MTFFAVTSTLVWGFNAIYASARCPISIAAMPHHHVVEKRAKTGNNGTCVAILVETPRAVAQSVVSLAGVVAQTHNDKCNGACFKLLVTDRVLWPSTGVQSPAR